MERQSIRLSEPVQAHKALAALWMTVKAHLIAGRALCLELRDETRSTAQSRLMWSCLNDIARQVEWHGMKLDAEAWKDMSTAALKRQTVVPGLDGGFVVIGARTSKMSKAEMTELIDFLHAFGDSKGVNWSRTSLGRDFPDEVVNG